MREREYLRQRYTAIFSSVGVILMLAGIVILIPLLVVPFVSTNAGSIPAFLIPAAALEMLGLGLWRLFRSDAEIVLSVQEGGIIVVLSWLIVTVVSAFPFMLTSHLSFSQAFFESVSGWTTTGLSVIDVSSAGPMILFYRSGLQLAGGAGLAIIMMSAILGPTGVGISSAEGRADQLVPQVRQSARLVLAIYACYATVGTLAYRLAGMSFFDAVNHSFCAVSTGGFSTRASSIGHWDSVAVEAVTIPLMILGNLSFVTAWLLWRGKFRDVLRNGEVRLQALLYLTSAAAVFVAVSHGLYPHLGKGLRVALFETVTALTTTGYSTVGYGDWSSFGILILIGLMLIGGGTCSTAGGIKQFRVYLMAKSAVWDIERLLRPRSAVFERRVWENGGPAYLTDGRIRELAVYVTLYIGIYALGTLVLCACGYSLSDSLFEFASAIGTVGLSVGVTSPTMPSVALWVETAAMFLGRLEFVVVFVSVLKVSRDFSRLALSRRP